MLTHVKTQSSSLLKHFTNFLNILNPKRLVLFFLNFILLLFLLQYNITLLDAQGRLRRVKCHRNGMWAMDEGLPRCLDHIHCKK